MDKKKKDKLAVQNSKKYWSIAEKIVEGLLEQGFIKERSNDKTKIMHVDFPKTEPKTKLVEVIANAILRNLTYGNLGTLTLRNNNGQIVAKLYILPDGTLADDSWTCNKGWK